MRIKRREFITLLGGTAAAWPFAARAQQSAVPVVGFLVPFSPEPAAPFVAAFREGLGETGFIERRNVAIEARYAQNDPGRLPELALDMVRHHVAVIATLGGPSTVRAARAASATVPIVFEVGVDPVRAGLVASLNRPGGNATGVSFLSAESETKQLGFLHALLPSAKRFAMLVSPVFLPVGLNINDEIRETAATIGVQIEIMNASNIQEIDAAFVNLVQKQADALLVRTSPLFIDRAVQIATLAARYAVPTVHFQRQFAAAGGLMSYGANYPDRVRQVGVYVGRILKGEKPADLPVIQPTKFDLVINLTTAKALGLTVPPNLLATADEVIE